MRMKSFAVLGTAMVLGISFGACRSSSGGGGGSGTGGSGTGGSGTGGTAGTGTGGTAGTGTGGTAGTGTGGTGGGTGGTAGSGGTTDGGGCTPGTKASIHDIDTGTVGLSQDVELTDVVATSQKFLVSESKTSGSCLWAVFATDGGQTTVGESTSMMIYSYSTPASTADGGVGPCPTDDGIPSAIKPGDTLHVFGQTDSHAPSAGSSCPTPPQGELQLRVFKDCPITITGSATVPAPHVLDTATANAIAAGTDTATLAKWGGALVELDNATADAVDGGGVVGPFGVITFSNYDLEAHDKIMYYDVKDPKNSANGWVYGSATTFSKIVGIAYLDYCTWSINPRNKCTDLTPKSDDCP